MLTIPNEANTLYAPQAAPDRVDIDAIVAAVAGTGVVSGCTVTAQGSPNMTVAVAAGKTSAATVDAVDALVVPAAGATDRKDIVVVDAAGAVSVVRGAPGAAVDGITPDLGRDPAKPPIPAGAVLLAEIYVAASTVAVGAGNIVDKRCVVPDVVGTPLLLSPEIPGASVVFTVDNSDPTQPRLLDIGMRVGP